MTANLRTRVSAHPTVAFFVVVSGYAAERPHPLLAVGNFLFWEPAHVIMQTRRFANLKRRAEQRSTAATAPLSAAT